MTKLKVLAAVSLCMAYFAGIATGWAGYTLAGETPAPPRDEPGSWLAHTLQLDEAQQEKLEEIWSPEAARRDGDDARTRIRALYDERNDEVRAMLSPEQQLKFDEIHQTCEAKKEAISQERQQRRDEAVEKTMAILNPEQQEKYKSILEDFEKRGPKREHSTASWGKSR